MDLLDGLLFSSTAVPTSYTGSVVSEHIFWDLRGDVRREVAVDESWFWFFIVFKGVYL